MCVLNQVFHYIWEQRETEERPVCKIGVRDTNKVLFCDLNELGSHFVQDQGTLSRADTKQWCDGSLGKEPGFPAQCSKGAAHFRTSHCLRCCWLCNRSSRCLEKWWFLLISRSCISPRSLVRIKLHYHRPNLTVFAAVWLSRGEPAASLQLLEDARFVKHNQCLDWWFNGRGQRGHKSSSTTPKIATSIDLIPLTVQLNLSTLLQDLDFLSG